MNQTTNYQLNQWVKDDQVRMEDFNADNAKIDAAIKAVDAKADGKAAQAALAALQTVVNGKGNCRIATGTYTGTGTFGVNSPNTLTFPFQPLLVVISANSGGGAAVLVPGTEEHCYFSATRNYWKLTWTGNSVSWYIDRVSWPAAGSGTPDQYTQMNAENMVYRYVVFGKNS